jgi:hypothetical protein
MRALPLLAVLALAFPLFALVATNAMLKDPAFAPTPPKFHCTEDTPLCWNALIDGNHMGHNPIFP